MKPNKTLAEWIRRFHESEENRLREAAHDSAEDASGELEEVFTVIVPDGAPDTEIGSDLRALNGVRWAFEWTMVPGPETPQ